MEHSLHQVKEEIKKVVRGKDTVIDMVLCALLSGGHILLEDIPGVGKTTMAVALSRSLNMSYKRMQFTPDVLPSDILGFSMYDNKTGDFTFRAGAIFTNLFLADEINRTSPKTQSALLEVMEEGRVTVEGTTYQLQKPFLVIATQNPIGASGTQKLPDSQLDRFFVRLSLGYPDHQSAIEILNGHSMENVSSVSPILSLQDLLSYQEEVSKVFIKPELCEYIVNIVERTRTCDLLAQGVSPRGSIAIMKMAKAHAFYGNRNYVTPEDISAILFAVCNHRIILSTKAKASNMRVEDVLFEIIDQIQIPILS